MRISDWSSDVCSSDLGQGVSFGLGGYALAMHLKLNGLGDGELPDFMMWSGVTELPWWWSMFKSGFVSIVSVFLLPGLIAAAFAWLMFRRRLGGVSFALITHAPGPAFTTLLTSTPA